MKLLLVEDEPKTVESVRQGLVEHGYQVDTARDGTTGLRLSLNNAYDLIISDVIMPGLSGHQLTRTLRDAGVQTPVLMLTALGGIDDKLTGFDAGADDYLTKPFEFAELLARVRVLTRRQGSQPAHLLHYQDLEMNLDAHTVTRQGRRIDLTGKEFSLLELLLRHPGRVLSKQEIAEKIWDAQVDSSTNVIEVYINLLRKKVDKDFPHRLIHTQYGMGYILKSEE